jgi:F-type H+-transporting ATPase subunit b
MIELLAADGAEHTELMDLSNWMPAVTTLVVFGIAFIFLAVKVWPQITKGLDDRQNKILQEIESAEEARRQADAALEEYRENLATARQEASDMIAKARSDAKATAESLRAQNETELSEMKDRATRDIGAAKRAAITEIHDEAATLAASIATKILQREITSDDQKRLVEESLRELAESARS